MDYAVRPLRSGFASLGNVDPEDVVAIVEWMKSDGRARQDIHDMYFILKAIFLDARLDSHHARCTQNPCTLTSEQLDALIASAVVIPFRAR